MDALYCTWRCVQSNRILLFSVRFTWSYVLMSTVHADNSCLLGDNCFCFLFVLFFLSLPEMTVMVYWALETICSSLGSLAHFFFFFKCKTFNSFYITEG